MAACNFKLSAWKLFRESFDHLDAGSGSAPRWFSRFCLLLAVFSMPVAAALAGSPSAPAPGPVARGRYLVSIAGCNDCHTERFAEAGSAVPGREWLKGSRLGWSGPWGTTYAINLRLLVSHMNEAEWLRLISTARPKPPMPWWALRRMTPPDQRAVYAFIRSLGPAGRSAPADLPPGATAPQPAVLFPAPSGAK